MTNTSKFILLFILCSTLLSLPQMNIARASETIYIRADGTVEGTEKIQRDGNVYTFTDNIYDEIVVEMDNIVVDGAGYTLQGIGRGVGLDLTVRSNVTIKNMEIKEFVYGIYLNKSSNNRISGNNITNNNYHGIWLFSHSNYNSISGNNITANNESGIRLNYSSNNTISGNNITNNDYGIYLYGSTNNTVAGNTFVNDGLWFRNSYGNQVEDNLVNGKPLVYLESVSDYSIENAGQVILINCSRIRVENLDLSNTTVGVELWKTNSTKIAGNNITNNAPYGWGVGILLYYSLNNTITGNNITNNDHGVYLFQPSKYNIISGNNITNNEYGIWLHTSSNYNTVSGNNVKDNEYGIYLWKSSNNSISSNSVTNNDYGIYLWWSSNNNSIYGNDITNNINGICLKKSSNNNILSENTITNNEYGIAVKFNSNYNTVSRNTIANNRYGIMKIGSNYNTVSENTITNNNKLGMYIEGSSNNNLCGNTITNNQGGIYLWGSSNNTFYHNNFINNTQQAYYYTPDANLWDDGYPSGGNYWSDYTDVDQHSGPYQNETGSDGIWDHPYIIDENNQDNYPIVPEFPTWTPMLFILIMLTVAIAIYKRRLHKTPIH